MHIYLLNSKIDASRQRLREMCENYRENIIATEDGEQAVCKRPFDHTRSLSARQCCAI